MIKSNFAVFISGRGSNLQSIINAINNGELYGNLTLVVADKPEAKGLLIAKEHGIKAVAVDRKKYDSVEAFEKELISVLLANNVEKVVLAGFMRILSPYFVRNFPNKIINIHPSLLPSFPGAHAHRDVIAYGVKVSGCTIHFVDEGMDSGPIIAQGVVNVDWDDTEDSLAAKVLQVEHKLYPIVINNFLQDKYEICGRTVKLRAEVAK